MTIKSDLHSSGQISNGTQIGWFYWHGARQYLIPTKATFLRHPVWFPLLIFANWVWVWDICALIWIAHCTAWFSVSVALFIIASITWLLWSYFKISTSYLQSNCEMFNGEPRNTVDWWKQRNLVRQKTGNKSNIQNLIFQMISRGKKLDQVVLGKLRPLLEIQRYHMIKYRYILLSLVCESKIEKTCWSKPFRRTSPSLDLVLFMIKISRVPKKEFFSSKLQRVSSSHLHRKRLQIVSSNLPTIWNHLKLFETVPARHWGTFFKSYQQDNFKCLSNWKTLLKKLFLFLANFHFYTQRRDVYPTMQWSWWFCLFKK